MSIDHKMEHIRKVKRAEYGSFTKNLELIGKLGHFARLTYSIPPYKVALMYTASKVLEQLIHIKKITLLDAINYLRKAQQLQQADGENNTISKSKPSALAAEAIELEAKRTHWNKTLT